MNSHLRFRAKSWARSYIRSKDRHSVHSPYMADFIEAVFRSKKLPKDVNKIEQFRKALLKDGRIIKIEDHGAGSLRSKSKERRIEKIARFAAKGKKDAAILFRAAEFVKAKKILELGTSLGLTSLYLSSNEAVQLTTFEGCPNTLAVSKEGFAKFGRKNISTIQGNFNETLPITLQNTERIDLAFIDGDHRKHPTLSYFELILSKLHNNSLLVFDDIHWSQEMEEAWEMIKADPRARVTVDIHRMGFVLFRKEMTPAHFDLRY